jgi:hypothetical protein
MPFEGPDEGLNGNPIRQSRIKFCNEFAGAKANNLICQAISSGHDEKTNHFFTNLLLVYCAPLYLGLAELHDRTFHCAKGGLISLDDQVRTTSRLVQKVAYVAHKRPERRQEAHNQSIAK